MRTLSSCCTVAARQTSRASLNCPVCARALSALVVLRVKLVEATSRASRYETALHDFVAGGRFIFDAATVKVDDSFITVHLTRYHDPVVIVEVRTPMTVVDGKTRMDTTVMVKGLDEYYDIVSEAAHHSGTFRWSELRDALATFRANLAQGRYDNLRN